MVVLRRGPTDWVEVISWNTRTDYFTHGVWFHGRIYEDRCGLSPDGNYFVYFAYTHGYKKVFTAVSRPPFLAQLAYWESCSTYGGGGRFINNQTLCLAYGKNGSYHPGIGPTEICMQHLPDSRPEYAAIGLNVTTNLNCYDQDSGFKSENVRKTDVQWYGRDHFDRRIFVKDGKLYTVDTESEAILLKDFNLDTPKIIATPDWARQW